MEYLNYAEYRVLGGNLDETAFNRNIARACAIVDVKTYNRIADMEEIPAAVKNCCRDLVETIIPAESTVTSRSQSSGAISQSESYSVKSVDDVVNEANKIISDYLESACDDNGTPLLYRGRMR